MNMTILMIDDDEALLRLVELNLTRAGYRFVSARHGIAGLQILESEKPALVILDITMPKLDGWEAVRLPWRLALDKLDGIVRVDFHPAIVGGPGLQVARLVWRMDVTAGATASAGPIRELVLIDAQTGQVIRQFTANTTNRGVKAIFSPDGGKIYAASNDSSLWKWDLKTGSVEFHLNNDDAPIDIEVSPDGTRLAAAKELAGGAWAVCFFNDSAAPSISDAGIASINTPGIMLSMGRPCTRRS